MNRSHSQIVRDFGASALLRALTEAGLELHQRTPQSWADRDSVPAEYWRALVDLKAATLEELAAGADVRRELEGAGEAPDGAGAET